MKNLRSLALACALVATPAGAFAFTLPAVAEAAAATHSGDFVKKKKTLKGSYEIVERDGRRFVVFSDDFKASNGPDLKVFLSPQTISAVKGKTAVNGSINLGELQKTRGAQEYEIPASVNLTDFASVLVHCEEYAVLWGGSNL